jgi:hypothetical protein
MDVRGALSSPRRNSVYPSNATDPAGLSLDRRLEEQNAVKDGGAKPLGERAPRGELEVDSLIIAVIVLRCNYQDVAEHFRLPGKRRDQAGKDTVKEKKVFEKMAERFRASRLHLGTMADSCRVSEGELLCVFRSAKFVKAVDEHLKFIDHFREIKQDEGEARIADFANKVGGRYFRGLAASVGIDLAPGRRSRITVGAS